MSIKAAVQGLSSKLLARKEIKALVDAAGRQGKQVSAALAKVRDAKAQAEHDVAAARRGAIMATGLGVPGGAALGGLLDGVTTGDDVVVRPSTVLGLLIGAAGAGFGSQATTAVGVGMAAGGARTIGLTIADALVGESE